MFEGQILHVQTLDEEKFWMFLRARSIALMRALKPTTFLLLTSLRIRSRGGIMVS